MLCWQLTWVGAVGGGRAGARHMYMYMPTPGPWGGVGNGGPAIAWLCTGGCCAPQCRQAVALHKETHTMHAEHA